MEPITITLETAKDIYEAGKKIQKVYNVSREMKTVAESEGLDQIAATSDLAGSASDLKNSQIEKDELKDNDIGKKSEFVDELSSKAQDHSELMEQEEFVETLPADAQFVADQIQPDPFVEKLENIENKPIEQRDFGIDKCTIAAKEIFNPDVIHNWANLSDSQRMEIAKAYAAKAADAFDIVKFNDISFIDIDGFNGKNDGLGNIYTSNKLIDWSSSPITLLRNITHEMRHQYQIEAIEGYHNLPEERVEEWSLARKIYNYYVEPHCYDPWGYLYNPLETDARIAAEMVVDNWSRDYF